MSSPKHDQTRRNFVKRGVYVAPSILTLAVAPEFAKAGSRKPVAPPKPPPPPKPPSWRR